MYCILQIVRGRKVSQYATLNCNFAGKHSWLDGSLVWPKPTAQAISLESFVVTDRSTKTVKLFYHEQFAIYGMRKMIH